MTWYVHTRAGGFRRWVAVARADSRGGALAEVKRLRSQDDPMWREAEYLVCETLHPLPDSQPTEVNP